MSPYSRVACLNPSAVCSGVSSGPMAAFQPRGSGGRPQSNRTFHGNIVGDTSGAIEMGWGVEAGKMIYHHFIGSWGTVQGSATVADGNWHYVAVTHDAGPAKGRLRRLRRRFPKADAVVFGHSHLPMHETEAGFQIFNPGSPTERRRAPRPSMGLLAGTAAGLVFEHVWL